MWTTCTSTTAVTSPPTSSWSSVSPTTSRSVNVQWRLKGTRRRKYTESRLRMTSWGRKLGTWRAGIGSWLGNWVLIRRILKLLRSSWWWKLIRRHRLYSKVRRKVDSSRNRRGEHHRRDRSRRCSRMLVLKIMMKMKKTIGREVVREEVLRAD